MRQSMNKKKSVLAVIFTILVLFLILYGGIKYRISYAKTEVVSASSMDGQYHLKIYMIGEPDWPFGPTHCRFELFDGEKRIKKYPFSVRNDGAFVHEANFKVNWGTDSVSITVSGEEQSEVIYILKFDGTVE